METKQRHQHETINKSENARAINSIRYDGKDIVSVDPNLLASWFFYNKRCTFHLDF